MSNQKQITTKKMKKSKSNKIESGIVEGFYGKPWSGTARTAMLEFMSRNGMDTYIYAPKDDPYHREKWREEYPPKVKAHLVSLIKKCSSLGIEFCWAVSPGLSMRYSNGDDFESLAEKFAWVASLGVKTFALFLDDIPTEFVHEEDEKKWKTLSEAHCDVTNLLLERLIEIEPAARLWFCPTEYIGTKHSPYLDTIGLGLKPEIGVFWTGPLVVSPRITVDDVSSIEKILRRKPLLWDNYPVNDYNRNKLNLGPLRARDAGIMKHLSGYFANPMNEAIASSVPLLTVCSFLRDPENYEPEKAWKAALKAPKGAKLSAKAARALEDFCDAWPAAFFFGEPPCRIQSAASAARKGDTKELEKLLSRLISLKSELSAHEELKDFTREVSPYLKGLVLYAEAASIALELKKNPGDEKLASRVRAKLKKAADPGYWPAAGMLRIFARDCLAAEK